MVVNHFSVHSASDIHCCMGPVTPEALQRNELAKGGLLPCASAVLHCVVFSHTEAAVGLLPTGACEVALLVAAIALWGMVHIQILDGGQQPALEDHVVVNSAVCSGRISETYD